MESTEHKTPDGSPEQMHGLSKWLKRYMEHRQGGSFMISQFVTICLCTSIGILSFLTGTFYRQENLVGLLCSGIFLGVTITFVIILSVPKWGGKWIDRWGEKLYAKDGQVRPIKEKRKKAKWPMVIAILMLFGCIFASVHLENVGIFPKEYRQPVTLIYILPFFIFVGLYQPPDVQIKSSLIVIWPILYILHAIFVLLNWWPIRLIPRDLDLFVGMFGYSFLTAVVIFLYSRYAMHRLKKAARQSTTNGLEHKDMPSS